MNNRRGRGDLPLLAAGQIFGQLSLLMVLPVLTRSFDPSQLGSYNFALATALILQPLATFRAEFVIPVTARDHAARLYRAALATIVVASLAAASIALVLRGVGSARSADAALLVAMLLFATSWMTLDSSKLIRAGAIRRLAARNFLAGSSAAALQLTVAAQSGSVLLLGVSVLFGRVVAIALTWRRRDEPIGVTAEHRKRYGPREAFTSAFAGVVANSSVNGVTILTGAQFGSAASGLAGTAQRLTAAPFSMVGQSLGQFLQTRASSAVRRRCGDLESTVKGFLFRLSLPAAASGAAMAVGGPILAGPVLGPDWESVGGVLGILAIPTAMQLLVAPTMPILAMLNRNGLLLRLQLSRLLAATVLGLSVGWLTGSFYGTCVGFAVASATSYGVNLWVVVRECRSFDRDGEPPA